MSRRSQYQRLRKSDLIDRVLELEAAIDGPTVFQAVCRLAAELGDSLTAEKSVDLAAARVLAKTLDEGPELPQAGISKQLADLVGRLAPDDDEEGSFADELRRRREERQRPGGSDQAEHTG